MRTFIWALIATVFLIAVVDFDYVRICTFGPRTVCIDGFKWVYTSNGGLEQMMERSWLHNAGSVPVPCEED